jgi:hypothetical protein
VVFGTTHDLLSLDWDRWNDYHGAHEITNGALGQVLRARVPGLALRPGRRVDRD